MLRTTASYSLYINDALAAPVTHLVLFAEYTCIYAREKHKYRVLCKVQRGLTAVISRYERWNIKIKEGKLRRSISPENLEFLTTYYN
jgi:hypothetical protein